MKNYTIKVKNDFNVVADFVTIEPVLLYQRGYHQAITDMVKWCSENDCGYRTSYNEFKFTKKEDMLLFIMTFS